MKKTKHAIVRKSVPRINAQAYIHKCNGCGLITTHDWEGYLWKSVPNTSPNAGTPFVQVQSADRWRCQSCGHRGLTTYNKP